MVDSDQKYRMGLVVGKFAPLHLGHQLVLDTAVAQCEQVIVLCYSNPDFFWMPSSTRAAWLRQLYPSVQVHIPDHAPANAVDDTTQRQFVLEWLQQHGHSIDAVFGSDGYLEGFAEHIGAKAVKLSRLSIPISGTALRQSVQQRSSQLLAYTSPVVRQHLEFWMQPVRSVVLLGAESTGKSTLSAKLAEVLGTTFVPEYGREVWERKQGQLELADYVHIAHTHRQLEDAAMAGAKQWLFVDTNAITTMFLSYAYEGAALPELAHLAQLAQSRYHHVLLCADDIPFEQDGWRDDHVWRSRAQSMIKYDLAVRGVPYTEVQGTLEQRVQQVEALLSQPF